MKKGKLYKEGKTWKIDSSELKTSPIAVLGDFGLSDSMSGEEIEFDHSGGPVNLIRHAGKEYRKKAWGESASPARDQRGSYQQRDQRHAYGGGQPQKQKRDPAFAPYNFIPLPNSFAPGQPTVGFDSFNETQEGRLSGYIALDIINNSPLFIRGNGEQSFQLKEGVILQGSSLRGMVRSYVELVSRGKFKAGQHFDDKRFYNRAMADMAINLREKYKEEMLEGIEAGYLSYCKKDRTYSITPAIGFDRVNNYLEFKYVKKHNGYEVHSGKIKGKKYNKLVLEPSTESPMPVSAKLIESYEADSNRSSKVNDILLLARKGKGNGVEFPNGVPMFFKRDSNNKILSFGHTRYYRYPYDLTVANHVPLNLQQGKEEDIPDTIFGRPGSENIPEKAGKVFFEDTTPVPYSQVASQLVILNNLGSPKPTTFQHYLKQPDGYETGNKKLVHWDTPLNTNTKSSEIRGNKLYWHKGNVSKQNDLFVEHDCKIKKEDFARFLRNANVNPEKILANFKTILDANNTEKILIDGRLDGYDEQTRNYLLDFFNLKPSILNRLKIAKPQNTLARVINAGQKFTTRIRFENLTDVELGALLFVLDLPDGCCHKLGMGKSLGLGSIRITPSLTLISRKKRYEEVFSEEGNTWNSGEIPQNNIQAYQDAFAEYMGQKTQQQEVKDASAYWSKDSRMQDLQLMLKFNHDVNEKEWLERTRYQKLKDENDKNEFKEREVLPSPSEVIKPDFYH